MSRSTGTGARQHVLTCGRDLTLIALLASPLAQVGCAFEAELLTDRGAAGELVLDAGLAGGLSYDAGSSRADAAVYWTGPDATVEAGVTNTNAIPWWPSCDNAGEMFDTARSGDRCGFTGGCSRAGMGCGVETAYCNDGTLLRSMASKPSCVPDDPFLASCARVEGSAGCCFSLWQCSSGASVPDPATVTTYCTRECDRLPLPLPDASYFNGCPDGRSDPPWPPNSAATCKGSFVCDSSGFSVGAVPAITTVDAYGRYYFCQNGVLQLVVAGPQLPWN